MDAFIKLSGYATRLGAVPESRGCSLGSFVSLIAPCREYAGKMDGDWWRCHIVCVYRLSPSRFMLAGGSPRLLVFSPVFLYGSHMRFFETNSCFLHYPVIPYIGLTTLFCLPDGIRRSPIYQVYQTNSFCYCGKLSVSLYPKRFPLQYSPIDKQIPPFLDKFPAWSPLQYVHWA